MQQMNVYERKIKLLTLLGISAEDIKALSNGEKELNAVLKERMDVILADPSNTSKAAIVCQNIRRSGASFDTLAPDEYLAHIEELGAEGGFPDSSSGSFAENFSGSFSGASSVENEAAQPAYKSAPVFSSPLRRAVARFADFLIYALVISALCRLVLNTNPVVVILEHKVLAYFAYAMMFVIEPLLLHAFATTPGKYLMGIRIYDHKGEKLSVMDAYKRTAKLLLFGFGLLIPLVMLYTLIKSLVVCKRKLPLTWDMDTSIRTDNEKIPMRYIICIAGIVVLTFADTLFTQIGEFPGNKEPLTEKTYYENLSHIVKYDGLSPLPEIEYELNKNLAGEITGVSFTYEYNGSGIVNSCSANMFSSFLALCGSSKSANIFNLNYSTVLGTLSDPFKEFEFDYAGYHIVNTIESDNYVRNVLTGYYYRQDESLPGQFKQVFTVLKK